MKLNLGSHTLTTSEYNIIYDQDDTSNFFSPPMLSKFRVRFYQPFAALNFEIKFEIINKKREDDRQITILQKIKTNIYGTVLEDLILFSVV